MKHVIRLYSTGIYWSLKIKDASLGFLFLRTFVNFLAPVLIAAHTANKLDLGDELENEGYESD